MLLVFFSRAQIPVLKTIIIFIFLQTFRENYNSIDKCLIINSPRGTQKMNCKKLLPTVLKIRKSFVETCLTKNDVNGKTFKLNQFFFMGNNKLVKILKLLKVTHVWKDRHTLEQRVSFFLSFLGSSRHPVSRNRRFH